MVVIAEPIEFQWDKGNIDKNQKKHEVSEKEAEEVFFDKKRITFKDHVYSEKEERYRIIGRTKRKRLLFIAFTIINKKVGMISARYTNRKEAKLYA